MIGGKSFPAARARHVLVDRLGIITEQAPPSCPSAKGTVEALFRWMTQRYARCLPNPSHGSHSAEAAAQAGAITLEELEGYFLRAIVDDYQQSWDGLRRQIRTVRMARKPSAKAAFLGIWGLLMTSRCS
jgi:hypothetical protein